MAIIDYFKSCPVCSAPVDIANFHFSCDNRNKYGFQHLFGKGSEYYFDWVSVNWDKYSISYDSASNCLSIYNFLPNKYLINLFVRDLIKIVRVEDISIWFENISKLEEKIEKLAILA
jgi:hypothetical protein